MIKALIARLNRVFPRWRGNEWTGVLGSVALTGPCRVEFSGHFVVDVRWMLRLGEFFVLRGAHVAANWEHFTVVARGWFQLDWRQVPDERGGWRWSARPRMVLAGHEPC